MEAYTDYVYLPATGHVDGVVYYYRIIRRDGAIRDWSSAAFSTSTTWLNSAHIMAETGTTGQFPVVLDADFSPGVYDINIYSRAGSIPANTDDIVKSYTTKVGDIFGF